MTNNPGMLSRGELAGLVSSGEIDTVIVAFTDLYGRLVGKRFDAGFFLTATAESGTHVCDYLLSVDMEMQPVPGYRFANWEKGYGDVHLLPDFSSLRIADWLERTAILFCDVQSVSTHEPVAVAPRSLLRRQIKRAAEMGLNAFAGSELEYYLFETPFREAAESDYRNLKPAGWYIEDYHILQGTREEEFNAAVRGHLARSGVPVECTKGEWGTGQHELNVRFTDVLDMADRHLLYKQCLKEVADRQGKSVTFMAKFAESQAGSSSHVHLSLWDADASVNLFSGESSLGCISCSDAFRWFLGGWMAHVPDVMVFYAPNVNSYKRYQAGSWAPTRIAWSQDNRTAGFRIVGNGESLRIECRIPGADCNPYLVYAAALASGLDGIANRTEPPPHFAGDIYLADELPRVPMSLAAATGLFEQSEFNRLAFGDDIVEHYTHFFRTEQAAYDKAVTDWERRRYFERI